MKHNILIFSGSAGSGKGTVLKIARAMEPRLKLSVSFSETGNISSHSTMPSGKNTTDTPPLPESLNLLHPERAESFPPTMS